VEARQQRKQLAVHRSRTEQAASNGGLCYLARRMPLGLGLLGCRLSVVGLSTVDCRLSDKANSELSILSGASALLSAAFLRRADAQSKDLYWLEVAAQDKTDLYGLGGACVCALSGDAALGTFHQGTSDIILTSSLPLCETEIVVIPGS
jgi:hypothetical protein